MRYNPGLKPKYGSIPDWQHPFCQGLILGLMFNEGGGPKCFDWSGMGNNGLWAGSGSNWAGNAVQFNGSDDLLPFDSIDSPQFEFAGSFSLSLIFRLGTIAQYGVLVSCINKNGEGWRLWTRTAASPFYYCWECYDGDTRNVTSTTAMSTSEYQHIVCVHDDTNLYLYMNGKEEGTPDACGNIDYGSDSTRAVFGAMPNNDAATTFQRFAGGSISEAGVYSRGLTAAEVDALYINSLTGRYEKFPKLDVSRFFVPTAPANDLLLLHQINLHGGLQRLSGGLR